MAGTGLTRIGPYPLLCRLGAGGMGTVYLALHRGLGGFEKRLAVKCLNPHVAEDQQFIAMLVDEARLTAQLSHPNIVQVIDLASSDGLHYLVMEYVEGIDARTLASASSLALDEAAQIIADAARGLAYAHRKTDDAGRPLHIVHRDISGHNLLVSTAGATKVLDFGIAKAASNRHTTEIGVLKGKLAYMSPEQALGKALDGRSDLFSLGIVLWELSTGRRLFTGDTDLQLLMKVQRCEIERPSRFIPGFPPALEAVLMRCLAPAPDERYADGDALADDLLAFARGCADPEPVARRIGNKVAMYLRENPPVRLQEGAGEATVVGSPLPNSVTVVRPPGGAGAWPAPRSAAAVIVAVLLVAGGVFVGLRGRESLRNAEMPLRTSQPAPVAVKVAPSPPSPAAASVGVDPADRRHGSPQRGEPAESDSEGTGGETRAAPSLRVPQRTSSHRSLGEGGGTTGGERAAPPRKMKTEPKPVAATAKALPAPVVAAAPAPQVASGDGFLSLNAVPWARVYVDGKPAAESTPLLRFALAPGRHKVVLVNPELRVRKEIEVEIASGVERRESIQLR